MSFVIGKQQKFPPVQDIGDILTEEWMEVSKGVTEIIESMGSNFSMTKSDMLKNIEKIQKKFVTNKEKFKKFEDLMKDEIEQKEDKKDGSGTTGGLWLKRGLEYLCEVFFGIIQGHLMAQQPGVKCDDSGAIKKACQEAYDITLKPFHNFIMSGIVKGAFMMSPTKEKFFSCLTAGEKGRDEELVAEMRAYEPPMRQYVYVLGQLFNKYKYDDKGIQQTRDPAQ